MKWPKPKYETVHNSSDTIMFFKTLDTSKLHLKNHITARADGGQCIGQLQYTISAIGLPHGSVII